MLVLSRHLQQKIVFPGIKASVQVVGIRGSTVRLGIEAPPQVAVMREEIQERIDQWTTPASTGAGDALGEEFLDGKLRDVNLLLGVARLQLQVGLTWSAEEAVEQARRGLEALRRQVSLGSSSPRGRSARRRKALLVEDNANERELLALFLRQSGVDVDTAGDGADALDYLQRRAAPDVVLLDMGLPRCDGATAVQAIRRDPRTADLKIFAVTGHRPEEFDSQLGIDGWFQKPVDPQALVHRLQEELDGCMAKT
jgi:carbon storage regulator CsrA